MKKIVLDTNVLLVSLPRKSKYHEIFNSLICGKFLLAVSNEILHEYEEILHKYLGLRSAEYFLSYIETSPYVEFVNVFFKFNLLQDQDDNKFVDCAIAAGADSIIIHDKDFNLLKEISFPSVNIQRADEFIKTLQ